MSLSQSTALGILVTSPFGGYRASGCRVQGFGFWGFRGESRGSSPGPKMSLEGLGFRV